MPRLRAPTPHVHDHVLPYFVVHDIRQQYIRIYASKHSSEFRELVTIGDAWCEHTPSEHILSIRWRCVHCRRGYIQCEQNIWPGMTTRVITWNLWKFARKFWNCEAPSFTNFLVNTLNKIITHCWRPADHLVLHREHLYAHLLNILHKCLVFPSFFKFWP
jgi:hypothetical protein